MRGNPFRDSDGALILVITSLSGLTTSAHVVGTTQSGQAEALYRQALGASAGQRPTDVIVVSSKRSTVRDGRFQQFVGRLAAQVRRAPGVTHVATDLGAGSQLVSSDHHAALITLRAASDADMKPVVKDVRAADGSGGFSLAAPATTRSGRTSRPCRRATFSTGNWTSGYQSPS